LRELLRWQLSGERQRWPKWVEVMQSKPEQRVTGDALRLTFINHATVLVQTGGINLLTDPVWSDRTSPVQFAGPKRAHAPGVALADLPPIDFVLVSHNHYDHLDGGTLAALEADHKPYFITPLGNAACMPKAIDRSRIIELDWDHRWTAPDGNWVEAEPVAHWSARTRSDTNAALWAGFTFQIGARKLFFAGDTGFAEGAPFAAVTAKHGKIDAALLPIGAYAPRWFMADAHMDPDEAIAAHRLLGYPPTLGIHFGTFQLTDEAREEPEARLRSLVTGDSALGGFLTLAPGGAWDVYPVS
jgi:L-ascorbate metabolism protein UlaG (beta-lactamase superfamily)